MNTVIVTGGAKGIGAAIVRILARNNYNVIINYKTSQDEAKNLQEELTSENCNVEIFKADVSKREEVQNLIKFTNKKYGDIDVLINNAGISQIKMFTDITDTDWNNMLQNNLNSVFITTQEVLKDMLKNKKGCIINISSIDGVTGAALEVHYSASKSAIDGLTKALAKELALSNIRVNSIAPGAIETNMNDNISKSDMEVVKSEIPMNKIGKPEDIAKCVKWLIEDEYTTGQVISINGGWYM